MKRGKQLTVDGRLDLLFGKLSLDGAVEEEAAATAPTQGDVAGSLIPPEEPQSPSGGIGSLQERQLPLGDTLQLLSEVKVSLDVTNVQVTNL